MAGSSWDAIVVGGGVAGAVAARELSRAGRDTLILEARDRLGGRTWYRPFGTDGRKVEYGGAWISPRTMHRARAEIERYGLRLTQRQAPGVDFRWRIGGPVGASFPLLGNELYELERVWYELIAAARRLDPDRPLDTQGLGDLDRPVASLLAELRLSPRTLTFFDSWARLGSGALSQEWSALQLLAWIAALDYSVLGYYAEVNQYLEFGTSSLLDAILDDGGFAVRLETPVVRLCDEGDEVVVTTAEGSELRAGAVIVATPVNVWGGMEFEPALTGAKADLARCGHPGRMKKVWIHARGVPPNVVALGDVTGFVWLSAEYEFEGGHLLVGFVSPPCSVDAADRSSVAAAVHALLPEADVLAADAHDWVADPWARGGWMVPRPGWLGGRWSEAQAPTGRICFAGADVATRWVGWIDGAIESGMRAAGQALAGERA